MRTYLASLVARERGSAGVITPRLMRWYEPAPRGIAVLPTASPEHARPGLPPNEIRQSPPMRAASRSSTPEPGSAVRAVPGGDRGARVAGESPRPQERGQALQSPSVSRAIAPDQTPPEPGSAVRAVPGGDRGARVAGESLRPQERGQALQ